MCQISLTFEYSRMKVPSLSRGCEIAQFFVRYMVGRSDEHFRNENQNAFSKPFQGRKHSIWATKCSNVLRIRTLKCADSVRPTFQNVRLGGLNYMAPSLANESPCGTIFPQCPRGA